MAATSAGPELPETIRQARDMQEFYKEFNRMPLFMQTLDNTDGEGGSNMALDALKAIAYDGDPAEVAENFKNQGNERFRNGLHADAIEFYSRALGAKSGDNLFDSMCYANRAAVNLHLGKEKPIAT